MLPILMDWLTISLGRGLRSAIALSANKTLSNDVRLHMIFMFYPKRDFLGSWIRK